MRKLAWWARAVAVGALACSKAPAQDEARVTVQGGGCARTPAGAVELARGVQGGLLLSQTDGYRVQTVRWDAAQHQSWAVIQNCAHPELPSLAVLTNLPTPFAAAGALAAVPVSGVLPGLLSVSGAIIRANAAVAIVKAGDLVRLWKSDANAHIELIATAEENGAAGARVRVRLVKPKDLDGQTAAPQFLAGVVRGPADVEMEP